MPFSIQDIPCLCNQVPTNYIIKIQKCGGTFLKDLISKTFLLIIFLWKKLDNKPVKNRFFLSLSRAKERGGYHNLLYQDWDFDLFLLKFPNFRETPVSAKVSHTYKFWGQSECIIEQYDEKKEQSSIELGHTNIEINRLYGQKYKITNFKFQLKPKLKLTHKKESWGNDSLTSNFPSEPPIANKKGLSSEKEIQKIAP